MKTAYPRVPFPLIVKATDGDVEAINQIVKHYRGYTSKRSLRRMTDEYGNSPNKGNRIRFGKKRADELTRHDLQN